ncbi:MAG: NAD(P)/FAD-dependent oxidoreductase [Candidatus Bipolaricaulota bacterium]|nr:NAD(P)/FAD-dependent oxidoreductase [Candidatus Bipolaricaulota bacterium]
MGSRVVIIGAGFGGLSCARALVNKSIDVLLLDKNNYHLFTPLLYQVASSLLDPSDIAYPVRAVFRRAKNVRFQMATVTEIDLQARLVKTQDGALIPYDYLVIATGSVTNYFGMHSLASIAHELKDIPVLPAFAPKLGEYARWQLERRGIEVRLHTRVLDVSGDAVRLSNGETIETKTLIWAAGVKASELVTVPPLPRTRAGRIEVDEFLRAKGHEQVFVIGDLAAFFQDGTELPMLARPAMQEGAHVAENILRLEHHQSLIPFRYRDPGIMATMGRNSAVAQLKRISLTGFIGWLAWLLLHLILLIGFRNRFAVLLSWAWEYIFYDRPVRLIARAKGRS